MDDNQILKSAVNPTQEIQQVTADLKPRPPREHRRGIRQRRPYLTIAIVVALVAAIVTLTINLLEGSLYFYNADEAVASREEIGTGRFTLQGEPIGCSIVEGFSENESVVAFSLAFGGAAVDVVHRGDPAELFQPDVAVVLDGSWVQHPPEVAGFSGVASDGWHFASDRMRIKHDNDYINQSQYDTRLSQSAQYSTSDEVGCEA